jgi:hypothetical protein
MSLLAIVHAPTLRDQIERLAYWQIWGRITTQQAGTVLVLLQTDGHIPAALDGTQLGDHYVDLVLGIRQRDGIEGGDVHPDEIGPEFHGDDIAALNAAKQRVEDALTALVGAP